MTSECSQCQHGSTENKYANNGMVLCKAYSINGWHAVIERPDLHSECPKYEEKK